MIAARQLAVGHGRSLLFRDASFELPAGECWAVVGTNGSGKTTLLATLAGLIPPLEGEVEILGKALREWRRPELSRHLGFLPQQQGAMFPYSVEEFVRMGRWPWRHAAGNGAGNGGRDDAVEDALLTMQLEALRGRALTRLSGGEVQRVCIAQLLAQRAQGLLLDEPTAHLDLPRQIRLMDLLRRLADRGQAIAIATHNLDLAWRYCHRLLVLGPGGIRIVARSEAAAAAAALTWAFEVEFVVPQSGAPDGLRMKTTI